jgi:uridine kinase
MPQCLLLEAASTRIADQLQRWRSSLGIELLIVAIGGDGALGKTTLAKCIAGSLAGTVMLSTDSFVLSRADRDASGIVSGDDPRAIDFDQMKHVINALRANQTVTVRDYDHRMGGLSERRRLEARHKQYLLVEGTSSTHETVLSLMDKVIFLAAGTNVRRHLRYIADSGVRGYNNNQFSWRWREYDRIYRLYYEQSLHAADLLIGITDERKFCFETVL